MSKSQQDRLMATHAREVAEVDPDMNCNFGWYQDDTRIETKMYGHDKIRVVISEITKTGKIQTTLIKK